MTGQHRRVLLTGATGFVGSAVARELAGAGHDVLGLVRSAGRARDLAPGVEPVVGDVLDPDGLTALVERVDAVVHAAQVTAPGRLTARRLAQLRHGDRVATAALAAACLRRGLRFVYTSGCFVYGDRGTAWIDEDTPFAPSPLGVGHADEVRTLRALHREGLDVVVLSPGFVYGPGGLFRTSFVDQAERGRLRCIGSGANLWSCVHRDDLAAAYARALVAAPPGAEYDVVDDRPLPLRELVDLVTDAMGVPRVGTVPPRLLGLLVGRPVVDSLVTSFRIRNARIRALGWTPRHPTVAEGLPVALAELRGVPAPPS